MRIPYFRIWYSTAFTTLFLAAAITTLATPADIIYQTVRKKILADIFSIAGSYILTVIIALFLWASRIYTNRAVLNAIPKNYIPVDAGEVPRKVHKMIVKQWARSAVVAWDSRPRDVRDELVVVREEGEGKHGKHEHGHGHTGFLRRSHSKDTTIIPPEKALAAWGHISHPGWSSPASDDLPNLEYGRIFIELPNLIEAKAVSLAPPDPAFASHPSLDLDTASIPDARIVALLQRPASMTLRDYLTQLSSFNLINPPELGEQFLAQYEYARFSTSALTEDQFRDLMATFANILTGMLPLDPTITEALLDNVENDSSSSSFTSTTTSSASSAIHHQHNRLSAFSNSGLSRPSSRFTHVRSSSTGTVRTAPSRAARTLYHTPSNISLGSEDGSVIRTRSEHSMQASPSPSMHSTHSVIHLNVSPQPGQLPYKIDFASG
ncbi:hypothetical protein EJ08DRAFT_465523 [Tothia fuscella]|uniref:Defect at low temperature protein 1 n=1 Tax=Tothia fuscella TaxID=1048955 RepID=A0A9P4U183_9PEZI|nr:hypothetical protein EJ08DRAFT_465523 [Tothia fuscella]